MLFMPFLLALTLFAQSASCPHDWDKEDGEIRPATWAKPAKAIYDVHDLATYPFIPKYAEPRPAKASYETRKEFNAAMASWRSRRRVDTIPKVYAKKRAAKSILKDLAVFRMTRAELNELIGNMFTERPLARHMRIDGQPTPIGPLSFLKNALLVILQGTIPQLIRTRAFEEGQQRFFYYNTPFGWPSLKALFDRINPPKWQYLKNTTDEDSFGHFNSTEEAIIFYNELGLATQYVLDFLERITE